MRTQRALMMRRIDSKALLKSISMPCNEYVSSMVAGAGASDISVASAMACICTMCACAYGSTIYTIFRQLIMHRRAA